MDRDWTTRNDEEVLIRIYETEIRESPDDCLHRDSSFESCQMSSQTEMDAESKGEVPVCLSRDVESVGIGEAARVSVRGHEERQDKLPRRNLYAADFRVFRCQAG